MSRASSSDHGEAVSVISSAVGIVEEEHSLYRFESGLRSKRYN